MSVTNGCLFDSKILIQIYNDQFSFLQKTISKKINQNNTFKQGNKRDFTVENIHKILYSQFVISKVSAAERIGTTFEINFKYLDRVNDVFNCSPVRFHYNGDITIVTPFGYCLNDIDHCNFEIEKGTIVFPLSNKNNTFFIPCGGPDPETNEIGNHIKEIQISEICSFNEDKLPLIKAKGTSSKVSKGDNWFVAPKQNFHIGDTILFKGEKVKVHAISTDFSSENRNVVRIEHSFEQNHSPQPFKIVREPVLFGNILEIEKKNQILQPYFNQAQNY